MRKLLTRRDLDAGDRRALRDLVRFGVMADDQIARRYADPALAHLRLAMLRDGGIVLHWHQSLEFSQVYSPTTLGRLVARVVDVKWRKASERHLAHDVTLVDLADTLLASDARLEWRTEREVAPYLDRIAPPPVPIYGERPHRPDGLLLSDGERIGIELEHSDKFEQRYTRISRWFATEYRLDRVRWYVDQPRVLRRLREINDQHGFTRDIPVEIEPFPPGVVIRKRPDRFER